MEIGQCKQLSISPFHLMFMGVKAKFLEIIRQALDDYLANLRKSDFHYLVTYEDQSLLVSAAVQLPSTSANTLATRAVK